eukprot:TRINITY_DN63051_c0_g1_i1.p1 TRINITY_DN63051_c0_g1~~TRINITY_DN63051_c0_g1_i1.p1  ORF type:complete len:484 (-),score=67.41 TRINITY_DN63051_c0_g1_i1:432-1883(-)
MGKKKHNKKGGSNQPATSGGRINTGGAIDTSVPSEAEFLTGDFENVDWLQEQQHLLEHFSKANQATTRHGNVHHVEAKHDGSKPSSVIIENQLHLLKQANAQRDIMDEGASNTVLEVQEVNNVANVSAPRKEIFAIRRIRFRHAQVPVLLQSHNGPCALLAVANALLLRGTLQLEDDEVELGSEDLLFRLQELCETLNAKAIREDANFRENVSQVVSRLPQLLDGLLLNCRFGACSDFEFTPELGLFDLFNLRLFHAWVEPDVVAKADASSYNVLAERLAVCAELRTHLETAGREPTLAENETLARGLWLEQWLDETRTQATPRGLQNFLAAVDECEVCVFFRNNHFNTVYKQSQRVLCALLTDVSFEHVPSAVWESIELDGTSGHLMNADFASKPLSGVRGDISTLQKEDLVRTVQSMGFSREQAEAGLSAVNWQGTSEAIEAILEPGTLRENLQDPLTCPACGKSFKSLNGVVSHRAAKNH